MTYIKINKPSLDYHQYSDFHVFTMNNFVRNVMQKGKYKKAMKIVRLGLLYGLKQLYFKLRLNDTRVVARTYRYLKRTVLSPKTKSNIEAFLVSKNKKYDSKKFVNEGSPAIQDPEGVLENDVLNYYNNLTTSLKLNLKAKRPQPSFSFFHYFNSTISKKKKTDKPFNESYKENILPKFSECKYTYEVNNGLLINTDEVPPEDKLNDQYQIIENLKFKKIYSKKPHTHYYSIRNLTVFDMIIQVYTMLTGVWYMRKAKVSGRTILIPSPLRPYRRVTTVTKMLLKGIRKRRREERFDRPAMVKAIGQEFFWLLLYNGFQYGSGTSIDNSNVWNAKTDSHKELVANLKNIKHLKYF